MADSRENSWLISVLSKWINSLKPKQTCVQNIIYHIWYGIDKSVLSAVNTNATISRRLFFYSHTLSFRLFTIHGCCFFCCVCLDSLLSINNKHYHNVCEWKERKLEAGWKRQRHKPKNTTKRHMQADRNENRCLVANSIYPLHRWTASNTHDEILFGVFFLGCSYSSICWLNHLDRGVFFVFVPCSTSQLRQQKKRPGTKVDVRCCSDTDADFLRRYPVDSIDLAWKWLRIWDILWRWPIALLALAY